MKVLILAGGRGTRLWPLSRRHKPKQFQKLISDKTMLRETAERLLPKFSWEDIFISTNKEYSKEVKKEFPELSKDNIIAEPVSRERVAALALFMAKLGDCAEPLLVLPSDHLIKKKGEFQKALSIAERFIKKNPQYMAVLGAKPTFPDTGLGYIKKGRLLANKIYQTAFFKEKPNLKRARIYARSKDYFWNMGIYLFYPVLMEKQIKEFVPDSYKRYKKIREAVGKAGFTKVLQKEYAKMDSVGLEYSIIENYGKIAVIPTAVGWSDIGSWTVLKNSLSSSDKSFVKGNYIGVDSENIMAYSSSSKLIAGIGVKNLIIAVTDDIIMICDKDHSQNVKEVIKKLEKQKKFNYI